MTYQEAIANLKILKISEDDSSVGKLKIQTYNIAIEALEKQIPKKIFLYGDDEDGIMPCPFCKEDLYDDKECGFNNCPYCGQAIDWEGVEEE